MRRIFSLSKVINFLYVLLIIISFLLVPYHNIRTGFTNWGFVGAGGAKGPVNAGALAVQRALTLLLITFYIYYLRLKRKIRDENYEIDLAIKESEDRRHRVEREYFRLKKQMQNIFDAMDDFVFICSKDFKIEFMNKSLKKVFGEGVGKKCYEILYGRQDACPWCFGKRVYEGEFVTLEHKHEINKRIYRIYSSPLINPDGSISKISVMHDITKEKEMQVKIESSEQYFRNLFENLPVACFGYDIEGRIITWNKAASNVYGFKKEDVLNHSIFDTLAQEKDRERTMHFIKEIFKGRSFDGLEWEDKTADGTKRYVYTSTYPLYDLDGNVLMGISVNIDITPQKTIEHELKSSKEHLEKIMETPQSLIVELSPDMKIKMFNTGCELSTGYNRSEVIGKDWLELFIPDRLKDETRFVFEEVKNDRNILPGHHENPILTKSGEEKIIFWSNTNLKDEDGKVISVISMGIDITERKIAQQKIVEAEEKYRAFLENVPVHVGVIDESGKFVIWNKYSEQMLGYTKEEALGKMSPGDIHETKEEAREVIEIASQKGIFDKELNLIHKDGRKIPVSLIVVPRVVNNKIVGFLGFGRDVSERKNTEKELLAAKEKLESIALKDPQTELYNNRYVVERLASEFERAKRSFSPLSLLLIDLDYFKSINDTYGHEFGDKALVQVAKLLKSELRANDIVARWGGEEFMVILPEVDRQNAILVSRKILRVFEYKGFGDEKNIVNLKCSVGIVSYPEDPLFSPKEMLEAVEKSVFKVKTAGGNGMGSYMEGFIKKDDDKAALSEKDRLLDSLKEKMSLFAIRGEESILEAIYSLSKSLELKDHTTRTHSEKTVHYAVKLAQRFDLGEREIENVRRAAILHDIGKLGIPDKILLKKGPLTKNEFEIVKQHPKIAAEIMSVAEFLKDSVPYVEHHHERYDGKGYPDGLKGEEIPFGARIVSIVDVYEALTADRPYRRALPKEEAIKIIKDSSGIQFDPKVVNAFLDLISSERT
ncbi:MAG: PAS domain S-box protein [Candidatus Omnitrophica bacterium]|nr:PAS domain S-box protein [Candidatus Omnitrophota bacterium]MDD5351975.1 PAS domain S-box protein [Candidatus Omnitrophota bacterium]MDD5550801.1 PAS domain S-box protein [Candidatus Omnitrophota bacterium]